MVPVALIREKRINHTGTKPVRLPATLITKLLIHSLILFFAISPILLMSVERNLRGHFSAQISSVFIITLVGHGVGGVVVHTTIPGQKNNVTGRIRS